MLLELIDRLDESIGAGETISTLRTQLATIREQTEALEGRLKVVEAQLKQTKSKLKVENAKDEADEVEEIGRKFLKFLAQPGRNFGLEVFASQFGIQKIVATYHANKLVNFGLIELVGYNPAVGGTVYILTDAGISYVVENKLV